MKRFLICLSLLFVVLVPSFSQPKFSSDWDRKKPLDDDQYTFLIGESVPCASESEASKQAWEDLLFQFASSVYSFVTGESTTIENSSGLESKILDESLTTVSRMTWKTEVPLYGVKELDRKTSGQSNGLVVVKILGYMTAENYEKSMVAVQNEETAELAYSYFMSKKISGFPEKRGETYAKWLKSNCAIFEFADDVDGEKSTAALVFYIEKLYRNIYFYRCVYDGFSAVAVYNQNDYLNGIISSLEKTECVKIYRDGGTVRLSWKDSKSFSSFNLYLKNLKDAKKIVVFGNEVFYLPSGDIYKNAECRTATRFKDLAQKNFGLTAVNSRLDFESYDDMKSYVEKHADEFSARWFVFCSAETEAEEYGRKAWVNATVSFVLFDLETGEEYPSDEATSMAMSAAVSSVSDEQVRLKSKAAIDNACNPDKNPESILLIMQDVFSQLP